MADLKISQLPPAGTLTGSELIELVQSGGNVQSTTGAVTALAPAPSPSIVNTVPQTAQWAMAIAQGASGTLPLPQGPGNWDASNTLSSNAGIGGKASSPSSTSMYTAISTMCVLQSASSTNAQAEVYLTIPSDGLGAYRKASGGLPVAGFAMVFVGGFDGARADQTAFVGYGPIGTLGATLVPSALLNMVGFGKDQGDTTLQFMVNNGSGTATKTDTGINFAAMQQHLFQVTITCDALGALITATIKDLEPTSPFATKTYTVADGATKNIVADTKALPHLYVGTGTATATLVKLGFSSLYLQGSMLGGN